MLVMLRLHAAPAVTATVAVVCGAPTLTLVPSSHVSTQPTCDEKAPLVTLMVLVAGEASELEFGSGRSPDRLPTSAVTLGAADVMRQSTLERLRDMIAAISS